jgi:hypothetical protein
MGYNLYVVKRGHWYEPGNRFGQEEQSRLKASGQLPDWVYFDDGVITVKSPTEEQVVTFVRFAKTHGWFVQGDDGEAYDEEGTPIPASATGPGLVSTLLRPLRHFLAKKKIERSMKGVVCPFRVGDRVRTTFRTGGVVIDVDEKAHHGLGSIKARFPDGSVLGGFFVGHDFQKES